MKRYIWNALVVSSFILNIYFLTDEPKVVEDTLSLKASAIKKNPKTVASKRHDNNLKTFKEDIFPKQEEVRPSDLNQVEADNAKPDEKRPYEEVYQELHQDWRKSARAYIERDLGLSPDQADFYFELAMKRQEEVNKYLEPKINNEEGEPYLYSIEDNVEIGRINGRYLQLLKASLGPEGYQNFKKFREAQNKKLMEEGQGYFWVEF